MIEVKFKSPKTMNGFLTLVNKHFSEDNCCGKNLEIKHKLNGLEYFLTFNDDQELGNNFDSLVDAIKYIKLKIHEIDSIIFSFSKYINNETISIEYCALFDSGNLYFQNKITHFI